MVLDPTFNSEAMATALGIPSSKHMVRRHLVEEMKTLIESDRWEGAARKESPRKSPQWCHSFVLISVFTRTVRSSFGYSSTWLFTWIIVIVPVHMIGRGIDLAGRLQHVSIGPISYWPMMSQTKTINKQSWLTAALYLCPFCICFTLCFAVLHL